MIVTIHQPEHMPWLGLLDKVANADLFVVLDTVQFRKNYFQNRNRIRTKTGWAWVTVPVRRPLHVPIKDIRIDTDAAHYERYLNVLDASYRRAPYFADVQSAVRELLDRPGEHLVPLNVRIIEFLFACFAVDTPWVLASELGLPPVVGGTAVTHAISVAVGATTYVSGPSGRDYLDVRPFEESGIAVTFHEFAHPAYRQFHGPFVPGMSAIDVLYNQGPGSAAAVLRGVRGPSDDLPRQEDVG